MQLYTFIEFINMKQRVKFALADIRYIQTQIQKILNRSSNKGQRVEKDEGKPKSIDKTAKISPSKLSNFSTTPHKNQSGMNQQSRNTSPKAKKKKSQLKQDHTFNNSLQKYGTISDKSITIEAKEEKQAPKPAMTSNIPQQKIAQVKLDGSHKSIMMMWKQKEKTGAAIASEPPTLTKIRQIKELPTPKLNQFEFNFDDYRPQPIKEKVQVPPYLQGKNNIPLRKDENYLIKKYQYTSNNEKQGELKEKYKLLDERLLRLRDEIKCREVTVLETQGDERAKEAITNKKHAIAKYNRFSPLNKFTKINQKLKRDYERSLSNQQKRSLRQACNLESDKPKWTH